MATKRISSTTLFSPGRRSPIAAPWPWPCAAAAPPPPAADSPWPWPIRALIDVVACLDAAGDERRAWRRSWWGRGVRCTPAGLRHACRWTSSPCFDGSRGDSEVPNASDEVEDNTLTSAKGKLALEGKLGVDVTGCLVVWPERRPSLDDETDHFSFPERLCPAGNSGTENDGSVNCAPAKI